MGTAWHPATPTSPPPHPHIPHEKWTQPSVKLATGAPLTAEAAIQAGAMGLGGESTASTPMAAQEAEHEGEWVATPWDASVRPDLASGPVSLPAKKFASLRRRRRSREFLAHLGYAVVSRPRQGGTQFLSHRKSLPTHARVSSIEEGGGVEGPLSEPASGGAPGRAPEARMQRQVLHLRAQLWGLLRRNIGAAENQTQ